MTIAFPSGFSSVKPAEVISASAWQEDGFGVRKSLAVALVVAVVAAVSFSLQWPIAPMCTAVAVWCVFTAVVIGMHRITEGTLIGRPMRQLYAVVMEANANFKASLLFPMTLFSHYHKAKGDLKGRPILLINGFLSFASTWHYHRHRLQAAGLGPIYTVNVGSGRSIRTYAGYLKETVQQIQKETGRNDLIIIGHSKGGLVGSFFATHFAKEIKAEVTDVITLGAPFKGTPFACFALSYDGAEMTPGSELQQELQKGIQAHPEIRFSYIASEIDGTVPVDSALPDKTAERQFLVKDFGHVSLLFSSRIADQICSWVKQSLNRKEISS